MKRTLVPRTSRLPSPLEALEDRLTRWMEPLWSDEGEWLPAVDRFAPRMDVVETDDAIEVTTELPGLKPEEFHVEIRDGELWITGEKKEEKEEHGKTFHRVERRFGEFRRVVSLPAAVDKEKVDAKFHDGVLKVTIPKSEAEKPRHVEVKT